MKLLLLLVVLLSGCGYVPEVIGQFTTVNRTSGTDIDEVWVHKVENGCGREYLWATGPLESGYTVTFDIKDCVAFEFHMILSDGQELYHYDIVPDNMRLVLYVYDNYVFVEVVEKL